MFLEKYKLLTFGYYTSEKSVNKYRKEQKTCQFFVTFLGWWKRDPLNGCERDLQFLGSSSVTAENHLEILWKSYHQHHRPEMFVVHLGVLVESQPSQVPGFHGLKSQRLRKRTINKTVAMMCCPEKTWWCNNAQVDFPTRISKILDDVIQSNMFFVVSGPIGRRFPWVCRWLKEFCECQLNLIMHNGEALCDQTCALFQGRDSILD